MTHSFPTRRASALGCFGRSAPRFLHHLAKLVWIIIVGIQAVEFSARDKLDQPVSGRAQLTFMDPERPITSRTIKFLELTACRGLNFGRNAIPCRGMRCNWRRNKHRKHEIGRANV